MTGRNLPGERLSIRTLSRTLKVGAMPIREALNRLASQRALETTPSRAFRVPVMSPQRIAGLFDIRRHLEAFATSMAVRQMTAAQIERLIAVQKPMLIAIDQGDTVGYLEANYTFHFIIYTSCGNNDLVALIQNVWVQIGPFLAGMLNQYGFTDEWRTSHDGVIEAIKVRDASAACAAIENDIGWATKYFMALDESNHKNL
jgi:DNA-binding GntR family transcriptional regulator